MAVDSLWLNLTNGNDIGGGKPTLTGPSLVDKTNIERSSASRQPARTSVRDRRGVTGQRWPPTGIRHSEVWQ